MDSYQALTAFAALSQPLRLEAFRLLIKAGPDGMAAGDIATALNAKANTTSQNLSQLAQAGLITSTRAGRSIIYRSNMDGLNALLRFMLEDCCGGAPETCAPVINMVAPCCGTTSNNTSKGLTS
ncbi:MULTISPECIES: ArsR/SmtB family transcription factor [Pacificibacter]|uniref:ArsR/SmtB family transcription factor n=1 Tax=Pacificibacter TaxID=1042323 RepID=UPI001C0A671D|nr:MULTISPECIES: metalloregulator ArsR/SmtB family transcription factor [Pacificibacter]MBU2935239.1 metalloregulator ArsR/SmtB family transcription factor [Pacificibacter marinus]MDO6615393.1 metalloregulator ArsR/SmtB family transcription factor [Pacificibacter sp. 1_MG-2023]